MNHQRRFLVVVRAGDHSLHPAWLGDPATRTWDLVVSYYGSDPTLYRSAEENRVDDPGAKIAGLNALLTRDPFWKQYEYVWLPDDDLDATQGGIDEMFALVARLRLPLAQPALSWASYYSFFSTVASPSFFVRFTNYVEVMAPCFSRDFLERCLPTFPESVSGWGIDEIWPHLLRDGERCAILDATQVTHTRPLGGPNYAAVLAAGRSAPQELQEVRRRHRLPQIEHGFTEAAISRRGRFLDGETLSGRLAIAALLLRDEFAFRFLRRFAPGSRR
jgi:hypothetical protein